MLSELSASGYAGLTLDKVAQRAETGRASLYPAELHHGADSEIMAVVCDHVLEPRIQVVLPAAVSGTAP